jgi:hypothetical protein
MGTNEKAGVKEEVVHQGRGHNGAGRMCNRNTHTRKRVCGAPVRQQEEGILNRGT